MSQSEGILLVPKAVFEDSKELKKMMTPKEFQDYAKLNNHEIPISRVTPLYFPSK